ncbi:MAG: response regulator [Sandaracinaceae bacterium]|nr:response regulator [Sandaracinaceae bacterium]
MARILVVDDSQLVVRLIERALRPHGHVVETLDSFILLGSRIREQPPDLLVLDLHMPALSGLSTGRLVRAHSRRLPILVYSSAPDDELRAAAQELSAQGFLQKGRDNGLLAETINSILRPTAQL